MTTYLHIIEFIAMIFSIIGSYKMGSIQDEDRNSLKNAFNSFYISNILLILLASITGLIFLYIQMLFFTTTAILGHYNITKNKTVLLYKSSVSLIIILISLYLLIENNPTIKNFNLIEIFAAVLAIVGSYIISIKRFEVYAFTMFIIADLLYIKIGVDNFLPFFIVQSIFFVILSLRGIFNLNKRSLNFVL